jgi:hypothetical protein
VAVRRCPNCSASVSASAVLAYSYDLTCPSCGTSLRVSEDGRLLAAWAGAAGGWVAWYICAHGARSGSALGWVLPIVFAILGFGIISPLALLFTAGLEEQPAAPTMATSGHASGSHHHGGGQH